MFGFCNIAINYKNIRNVFFTILARFDGWPNKDSSVGHTFQMLTQRVQTFSLVNYIFSFIMSYLPYLILGEGNMRCHKQPSSTHDEQFINIFRSRSATCCLQMFWLYALGEILAARDSYKLPIRAI